MNKNKISENITDVSNYQIVSRLLEDYDLATKELMNKYNKFVCENEKAFLLNAQQIKQKIKRLEELQSMDKHELIELVFKLEENNEQGCGLNKDQIKQIQIEKARGKSIQTIAEEFNCNVDLVYEIVIGDSNWINDDIDMLRRRIKLREGELKRLDFPENGETYQEYLNMKNRLKELEILEKPNKFKRNNNNNKHNHM